MFISIFLLYLAIYSIHFLECIKVCPILNQHNLFYLTCMNVLKACNLLAVGIITQTLSMVLDNFTTAMSMVSLHDTVVGTVQTLGDDIQYMQNGSYWKMIAFAAGVGGNALCIGSLSGLALMKMERIRLAWYFRNVGWKALVGSTIGLIVLYAML